MPSQTVHERSYSKFYTKLRTDPTAPAHMSKQPPTGSDISNIYNTSIQSVKDLCPSLLSHLSAHTIFLRETKQVKQWQHLMTKPAVTTDGARWQGARAAQPLEANSSGIVLFLCWPHAVISLHSEMMLCILKQNSRALHSIYDMYRYVASSRCLFAQFRFYKWQDSTRCSIKLCRGQPGSCAQERAEQQKERDPGTEETEGR